mmetsp:Transcript_3364/g.8489  ORF Transcript_3364/g.8489 Transcript_3364/m.8489 type:complete len:171 (+) Transcript_3364:306-818(+)
MLAWLGVCRPREGLVETSREALRNGTGMASLLDPGMDTGAWGDSAVRESLQLAMECVHQRAQMRPSMESVATRLTTLLREPPPGDRLARRNDVAIGARHTSERLKQRALAGNKAPSPERCLVCQRSSATHALSPCGHVCVCDVHAVDLVKRKRRCPICGAAVKSAALASR